MKRVLSILLSATLSVALLAGCSPKKDNTANGNTSTGNKVTVGMVTDTGGVNDESFNQSAWEGLQKAEKELGVAPKYLESKQDADYGPNLENFTDQEMGLVVGVGFKFEKALLDAAKANPNQKYAIVDFAYTETPKNVLNILFSEQQGAFLVGYIAGKTTTTNKVGFVGGMDVPVIDRFKYGYEAGVQYAAKEDGKKIDILVQYAESFTDDAKGRAITKIMIQQGADIVFHAAGGVGKGVIEEAKAQGKYAIGVDRDQSDLAPETVITSAVKYVGNALYNVTKDLQSGNFKGGETVVFGLKEGGVGFAKPNDKVAPETVKKAEELQQKVINGEITPPGSKADYDKFISTL